MCIINKTTILLITTAIIAAIITELVHQKHGAVDCGVRPATHFS